MVSNYQEIFSKIFSRLNYYINGREFVFINVLKDDSFIKFIINFHEETFQIIFIEDNDIISQRKEIISIKLFYSMYDYYFKNGNHSPICEEMLYSKLSRLTDTWNIINNKGYFKPIKIKWN